MKALKSILVLLVAACTLTLASCGSDGGSESGGSGSGGGTGGGSTTTGDVLSPDKQKAYLETVALEFMKDIPSSDFTKMSELGKYISDTYVESYDWDGVGEWASDILESAQRALGTTTTKKETEYYGDYTYRYNSIYTNYESVLYSSNFTGHFIAKNGRWSYEKANDLQFVFNDESGQQCVLKLETGGSIKKVHAVDLDEWQDWDGGTIGNVYTSNDYYDRTKYTIGVPEKVVLSLTQGGSMVVKASININLSNITNDEFDISKGKLNLSTTTELGNGYKFDVSQLVYNGNKNASVTFTMSKNGKTLTTAAVSSDLSGIPSCNISAFVSDGFDKNDYDASSVNAKNAYAKLDVLGKVQIQGTLKDVRKYTDYIDKAYDNDTKESTFKSYINQANSLADINLFYDGKSVKQATVKLESFADENWYGENCWVAEPILNFYDGSSYSTFEAFFNGDDFKKTIDAFRDLLDRYADLIR